MQFHFNDATEANASRTVTRLLLLLKDDLILVTNSVLTMMHFNIYLVFETLVCPHRKPVVKSTKLKVNLFYLYFPELMNRCFRK